MKFLLLTLFPEMFNGLIKTSIVGRAVKNGLIEIECFNLRDWSTDNYKSVDDRPYGGGAGMILRVDIIDKALKDIKSKLNNPLVILMDAGGKQYNQSLAADFALHDELIFICGHYEGVDYRVRENLVDEVISIGPYVLSGGELPAMTIIDSVTRLLPGALGNSDSLSDESHLEGCLEYPQYTRPLSYNGWEVPEVLLSGNHAKIEEWKRSKKVKTII